MIGKPLIEVSNRLILTFSALVCHSHGVYLEGSKYINNSHSPFPSQSHTNAGNNIILSPAKSKTTILTSRTVYPTQWQS